MKACDTHLQPEATDPAGIKFSQKLQDIPWIGAVYRASPWFPPQFKPFSARPTLPIIIAVHSSNDILPATRIKTTTLVQPFTMHSKLLSPWVHKCHSVLKTLPAVDTVRSEVSGEANMKRRLSGGLLLCVRMIRVGTLKIEKDALRIARRIVSLG